MKNLFLFLFLLLSAGEMKSIAFTPQDSAITTVNFLKRDSVFSLVSRKGYVPSLFKNFGLQATAPFHVRLKDAAWVLGVASATAILFHYDFKIDEGIRYSKDKKEIVRYVSPIISEFGNSYGIGLVGACGLIGVVSHNRKLFQTSLLASQAAITAGVWVRLVKYCTSRERPSASYTYSAQKGHPGGYWYGFFKQYDTKVTAIGRDISYFDAFPSGHTSTAFAIASVFAIQYSDKLAVPVIAYSLAGLVGISRMTEHTHWASDVFVGAWAGYLCARQVVVQHKKVFSGEGYTSVQRKRKADLYLTAADQFTGIKLKMVY